MTVFKRGASLSLAQLIEKTLSFGIILLASRILKTEGIGEFFYYFSLVSLFIPVLDLGLQKLLIQQWSRQDKEERQVLMTRLFILKLTGGLVALLLALATDALVRWGHANPKAILACFVAIFSMNMGELLRRPRFMEQRIGLDIAVPVFSRMLTLAGVLILLHRFVRGYQLAYLYALANVIGMLVSFAGIRGHWPVKWKQIQHSQLLKLTKAGIPFSLTSLFVMLSLYIDSVMLGHFSLKDVGGYGAAYRVILVVAGLSGGTALALFPKIARMTDAGDLPGAGRSIVSVLYIHLMLFGMFAIGGFFMADQIMIALYGLDFSVSGQPFRILSALIILVAFTNVIGHSLEAMGHQRRVMKIALYAVLFNVVANLLFIPWLGMVGAAITTVLTESIVLTLQLIYLHSMPELFVRCRQWIRPFLFLVSAAVIFALLPVFSAWLAGVLPVPAFGTWIALACGGGMAAALFFPLRSFWLSGLADEPLTEEMRS